jgi:hypothetical protein
MSSCPASPVVAPDERHRAERLAARPRSLRSASILSSFAPILLWAAAVLDAVSEALFGAPVATSAFGGLLAGSTLASLVVIAVESANGKGPPEGGAATRVQRVEDSDAVQRGRS